MKLNYIFFTFLFLSGFVQFCFSQQIVPKAVLFDEVDDRLCGDPWKSRLDNFAVNLNNKPDSRGFIIFYGELDESVNRQYLHFFKYYLTEARAITKDRLFISRGNSQEKMRVELWLVPNGEDVKPKEGYKSINFSKPTILNKGWYYPNVNFEDSGLISDGCVLFYFSGFAEVLKENQNLAGYIVIYTEFGSGAKTADRSARIAFRNLKQLIVPINRVKTVYGGNRQNGEIELWLVPEGQKLPNPTPDKRNKKGTNI
jgi:hypothetical protein